MSDIKTRLFTILWILIVFCILWVCHLIDTPVYKFVKQGDNNTFIVTITTTTAATTRTTTTTTTTTTTNNVNINSNNSSNSRTYEQLNFHGGGRLGGYNCSKLEFSSTKLPITALASYPGSGNTWLRHLLQKMTGIATGSVYHDNVLLNHGFPGEGRQNGSVVAIKTHFNYNPTRNHYDRTILLIRNPYEAILSRFKYRMSMNHLAQPNLDVFIKGWRKFFAQFVDAYRDFYISWLRHQTVLPVLYDNLKSDLPKTLSRIHSFLNTGTLRRNMHCCLADVEGGFHRKQSGKMSLKFFYSKVDIIRINKIIHKIHAKLKARFSDISFQSMMGWIMK